MMFGDKRKVLLFCLIAALTVSFVSENVLSQSVSKRGRTAETEFFYINRLQELRMSDYAEMVLADLERDFPNAAAQIKVVKLEQLLSVGKFDEAMKIIAAEPDQESLAVWSMRIKLADYYYGHGKYNECIQQYEDFLNKYTTGNIPEQLLDLYKNSAYKFAQILILLKMDEKALAAYEKMRNLKEMDGQAKRQVMFENAELLVRLADENEDKRAEYLTRASKIIDDILWEQDIWFGRSVALMAHIDVIKGDVEHAQKLVKQYMPMLKQQDDQLKEMGKQDNQDYSRLSPIAECRYLMGKMLHEEAKKELAKDAPDQKRVEQLLIGTGEKGSGALQELANVYVRYPASSWAPDASRRVEEIIRVLGEKYGLNVGLDITEEQKRSIAEKQFSQASLLYNQKLFEECITTYREVLNQYPDSVPQSISGLGSLAKSYIQAGDTKEAEEKQYYDLCADMVAGHLAERFCKNKLAMNAAGSELISLAMFYRERNQVPESDRIYQLFFDNYQDHPLAASMLMASAETAFKNDDLNKAVELYSKLSNEYLRSPLSVDALKRLAECYSKEGNVDEEIKARTELCNRLKQREDPGNDLVVASYMLGRAIKSRAANLLKEGKSRLLEAETASEAVSEETPSASGETEASAVASASAEGAGEAEGESANTDETPSNTVQMSPTEQIAAANKQLAASIKIFSAVMKMLDEKTISKYQKNEQEKETNQKILQGCYFDSAHALTLLTLPESNLAAYKSKAVVFYESIRKNFPDSAYMPSVLMQIGTLRSTIKTGDAKADEESMRAADEAFAELSEKYPDSNEAKNVYFIRGKTLIELGYRRQGVEVLKKMFGDAQKYSAGQLLSAGQELVDSKEYELAGEGFDLALSRADGNEAIIVPATVGKARVCVEQKKYAEAVDILDKFVETYKNSYLILEALDLMSRAGVMAAQAESDANKRIELFNRSLKAVKTVRQYKKSPKDLAETDVEIGKILEVYASISKSNNDEATYKDFRSKALVQYQQFIMSADVNNADVLPSLEEAYALCIPIMLEFEYYDEAKTDCDTYLGLFPKGKNYSKVLSYRTEAEQGLLLKNK